MAALKKSLINSISPFLISERDKNEYVTAVANTTGSTFLLSTFHIVFFQKIGFKELKVVLTFLT